MLRLQGQGGRWFGGAAVLAERDRAERLGMSILVLDGITGVLPLHEPFMWLKEQKTQSKSIKFMLDPGWLGWGGGCYHGGSFGG